MFQKGILVLLVFVSFFLSAVSCNSTSHKVSSNSATAIEVNTDSEQSSLPYQQRIRSSTESEEADTHNQEVPEVYLHETEQFILNGSETYSTEDEHQKESIQGHETSRSKPFYIDRVEHTFMNSIGVLGAVTFYDKPVLIGESVATTKINEYFETECNDFFYGMNRINFDGRRTLGNFQEQIFSGSSLEQIANERAPFSNTVIIEAMYYGDDYISFIENTYWTVGGVNTGYSFGATFDMQTGSLLSLDHFFTTDIVQFREIVETYVITRHMEILGIEEGSDLDYLFGLFRETIACMEYSDFEYCYDGSAIYLLLNEGVFNGWCYVMRWDLETGEITDDFTYCIKRQ